MDGASSRPVVNISDIGFSVLHDPQDAIADIVFVHGLQGHPRKTWTCERVSELAQPDSRETPGSSYRGIKKLFSRKHRALSKVAHNESDEVCWPADLLSEDCANLRILTWGYDSKVSHFFGGATNQSNIAAHARNLLRALKVCRLSCQGRSLIFVAHSLGGIIVKDVFRRAAADTDPELFDIYSSTAAIVFLGTPHRGSSKAGIAEVVRKIVSVSGFDTTDQNIRALSVDSSELEFIHELFMKLYERQDRNFQVFTFQEAKGVTGISYLKLNERVVEPFSSSITTTEPTQTINANHMSMCRFSSKDDEGYKQILGEIRVIVSKIQQRREQDARERNRQNAALETQSPSQTTTSAAYSFNDVERNCAALLAQNTSDVAEYKSSLPSHVEGTCQWILSNPQYCEWNLQTKNCLLWVIGYPGSGKTILSAYIMEYLHADESSPGLHTTLCYFFCDEKIKTQRDGKAILRSFITQLIIRRRLLIKYVKAAYDLQGPQFDQNFNTLWRIFIAIAGDKRVGPISVVVDAIDECDETTRKRFLQSVNNLIAMSRSPGSNVPCIRFLITSRPLLGRQYTTNLLQIDASENNVEQDLKLVIQAKLEGITRRTQCKPDTRAYLENVLYSKADRTFLWVTLVLDLLEKSYLASRKDFKLIVDELPQDLTTTYEHFLHGIPTGYQAHASKLLHFLVGSSRTLTLEEMRILMAVQHNHRTLADVEEDAQPNIRETIEGVLGSLVRIWDGKIYLVHQSLKEFLQNLSTRTENSLSALYGIDSCNANLHLAEACVSYLLLDDFKEDLFSRDPSSTKDSPISPETSPSELESTDLLWGSFDLGEHSLFKDPLALEAEACEAIKQQYPLFDYSAKYWAEHFHSACLKSSLELQESVLLLSDATNSWGLNWLRFYWLHAELNSPCPRDFTPIVTGSYFGHITSLNLLLKGLDIERYIIMYSIYWASRMGHCEIVDLLLRTGVDIDMNVVDGQSPLVAAIQSNHVDVVKRLLEDDGFISERKGYRVNFSTRGGRTPLSIAAGNGYVEIVRQLLQHRQIQPDIADTGQWTPLFWSVSGQNIEAVKLLLADKRVSVNHVDKSGRNVLSWAAAAGELEIVRHLVSLKYLKADAEDQNGRTALSWAAGNGHLETTAYLRRSQRIDVSRKDKDGRSALSWACSGNHHRVVEYLIKYDTRGVDEEDVDGWTPLAWALFTRAPKTVQVLLDSGLVDPNKKDKEGRSALSFAAGYGYLDIVQMLLERSGIEIDSRDNDGQTPLSHATRYPDIVKALQNSSI